MKRGTWVVGAMVLAPFLVSATAAETWTFKMGRYGGVEFQIPEGWTRTVNGPDSPGGAAIHFEPPGDVPLILAVSPFPNLKEGTEFDPSKQTREMVASIILEGAREYAEEKEISIRTLTGPDCVAHYISVTDRNVTVPTPDDYKYGTQGFVASGRALATFTVLTNVRDAPEHAQALEIIRSVRHTVSNATTATVTFPGASWSLLIDLPGFELDPPTYRAEPKGVRLSGKRPNTGTVVTIFLEPAKPGWTAAQHRDDILQYLQRRDPVELDVKQFEKDGIALLQYRLEELNHLHMNGVWVRDDVWVDVHLSKVMFEPEDQKELEMLLWSVRYSDRVRP